MEGAQSGENIKLFYFIVLLRDVLHFQKFSLSDKSNSCTVITEDKKNSPILLAVFVFFSTSVVVICFLLLSVSIVPEVLVQQNTRKDSEKAKCFDSGNINGIVGKEFLNCKIIKRNKTSIFFHSLLEAIKIY